MLLHVSVLFHVTTTEMYPPIGADSMGAIAPTAKSCGGDALKSPPREFCYVIFETVKCTVKHEFIIMPVTKVVHISA